MAQEQRIIGGALLVVGAVVVYILITQIPGGGVNPQEAFNSLTREVWPAYEGAEKEGDYTAMRREAGKAEELVDQGGPALDKLIRTAATTGDRKQRRLLKLIEDQTFEKNADGLFGYRKKWYPESSHRALHDLDAVVDEQMKVLRQIRIIAKQATAAVEEARKASKLPLPLPDAPPLPEVKEPILDPNPIYNHDRELYRVFGLDAETLGKAIATANPGGSARPARLRWNRNIVPSSLAKDVEGIPELAVSLSSVATAVELNAERLSQDPEAAEDLAELIKKAATQLGDGAEGPDKATFVQNRAVFEKAPAIVRVLRTEAEMLEAYQVPVRVLAKQFTVEFKLE